MDADYGFNDEHSAEFNRSIQQVEPYAMRTRWIIVGLLLCMLLVAAYFMFSTTNPEPPLAKNAAAPTAPPPPVAPPNVPTSAAPPPSLQPPPTPTIPPEVTVPPEVAKDPVALAYFLAEMTPISFYGKVVDEKGVPIAGATAKISVGVKVFKDGDVYTTTSDGAGLFSITGVHGLFVGVTVSKEGYYRLPRSSGKYGYAAGVSSDGPRLTPDQPAVFMLRKKGEGVQLILRSVTGHMARNGTPTDINLEEGQMADASTGNFRLELWSGFNDQDPNEPYDWKYRMSVPGGGLIERTDNLAFEAPDDGYQATDEGSFTVGQDRYTRDLNKQYFIKLKDGRYARITVSMGGGFNILAYINPTSGDRNLEYDSSQRQPAH